MNNLKDIIQEKLKITHNSKSSNNNYKIMYNNICDYLCKWLYDTDNYRGRKNNRLEFLKEVNNNIMSLLDYFTGSIEDMSERLQIPYRDLVNFIEENNDQLVDNAKEYYHEIYNKLSF